MRKYSIIILSTLAFLSPIFCFAKLEITEIMYDLPGTDDKHEWVEIYNNSAETIDLTDWKLNDGDAATNHSLNAPPKNNSRGSLVLAAGEYALLAGDAATLIIDLPTYQGIIIDTVISLKNTGATLSILDKDGNIIDSITYSSDIGAAGNGKTLAKNINGQWQESINDGGSPGATNNSSQANNNQQQTTTPPANTGTNTNSQPTTSSQQTNTDQSQDNSSQQQTTTDNSQPNDESQYKQYSDKIYINEFIPDPVGLDQDNEWIELINTDNEIVNLSGWQLGDNSATAKPFVIAPNTLMQPNQILVFNRTQTKIALNNNGDSVKLFFPNKALAQEINYPDSQEGWSIARVNTSDYSWTSQPTLGTTNVIKQAAATKQTPTKQQTATATANNAQQTTDEENQQPFTSNAPDAVPSPAVNPRISSVTSPESTSQKSATKNIDAQTGSDSQTASHGPLDTSELPNQQLTATLDQNTNIPVAPLKNNQTKNLGKAISLIVLIAGLGGVILIKFRHSRIDHSQV